MTKFCYGPTDVFRFIFEVERGEKPLSFTEHPDSVWAGNVTYTTKDGWTIVVFNDCCSFDYIDSITDPSGQKWESPNVGLRSVGCELPFFFQYDPPEDVVKNIYHIGEKA